MESETLRFPTFESFKVWFDERTRVHPFKTGRLGRFYDEFVQGRMPIGLLREYAKQYYIFIQLTNTNVTWALVNYVELWLKDPALYEIVAAKVGSELSDPAPGGHGRTYVKYARYIGLDEKDLHNAKPIPELEARFNTALLYRSQSPAQTAVRWMLEGFVGFYLKFWRDTLHEKYSVPDGMLEYFDIHVRADLEEHGPEGEMFLAKLYRLGRVTAEDYRGMATQVDRAVQAAAPGVENFYVFEDAIYDAYYGRRAM